MDIIEMPRTKSGNSCVLVMVDYVTRWPEVAAMPNQEAATVTKTWINKMIARWGAPERILTDQSSNFTVTVTTAAYHHLGVR